MVGKVPVAIHSRDTARANDTVADSGLVGGGSRVVNAAILGELLIDAGLDSLGGLGAGCGKGQLVRRHNRVVPTTGARDLAIAVSAAGLLDWGLRRVADLGAGALLGRGVVIVVILRRALENLFELADVAKYRVDIRVIVVVDQLSADALVNGGGESGRSGILHGELANWPINSLLGTTTDLDLSIGYSTSST